MSSATSASLASRIDPVAKITWLFLVSVAGSVFVSAGQLASVTAVILIAFTLCKKEEWIKAWAYRWLIIFIPGLLWFYHGVLSPSMIHGGWNINEVRWSSASYSIKILNSVFALTFFLATTDVRQLINRLAKLGMPIKMSFAIYLMLRFAEILRVDALSVRDAMRVHRRSYRLRFVRYPATLVLLGMHRAEQSAMAMDLRGFPGVANRTYYGSKDWSGIGWLLPAGTAFLLIVIYLGANF